MEVLCQTNIFLNIDFFSNHCTSKKVKKFLQPHEIIVCPTSKFQDPTSTYVHADVSDAHGQLYSIHSQDFDLELVIMLLYFTTQPP